MAVKKTDPREDNNNRYYKLPKESFSAYGWQQIALYIPQIPNGPHFRLKEGGVGKSGLNGLKSSNNTGYIQITVEIILRPI